VVGAIILVAMQTEFATLGAWVIVAQGAAFVLCVLFLRKGVVGTLEDYLAQRSDRAAAARSEPDGKAGAEAGR